MAAPGRTWCDTTENQEETRLQNCSGRKTRRGEQRLKETRRKWRNCCCWSSMVEGWTPRGLAGDGKETCSKVAGARKTRQQLRRSAAACSPGLGDSRETLGETGGGAAPEGKAEQVTKQSPEKYAGPPEEMQVRRKAAGPPESWRRRLWSPLIRSWKEESGGV